ncbi:MAG: 16S rRNA (cytosine(1402)-N(4))-methyltransferase RsmH [Oligoflexia bacterium]|nr:16S rRNA (cytosine(1402)-N(4))-methyltransferase RsmH [Oligoflexia bacterium]MBF0364809.1 16S rRNA (cytosine(1402)-N(4))-methyltransferase RsmH [Oligoflexia bacterium]
MADLYGEHVSVLKDEIITLLTATVSAEQNCHYFADMTFGGGGHTLAFAACNERFRVMAVDQDPDAIANGKELILQQGLKERVHLLWSNFSNFPSQFEQLFSEFVPASECATRKEWRGFQGILIDLGVSSHQFDCGERGFSFRQDAPLDMRMNYKDNTIPTAADLVNSLREEELADLIFEYGEERFSRRIARAIVQRRSEFAIKTTMELEDIIFHSYPANLRHRHRGAHPATRTFQALRIAVNRELDLLTNVLPELCALLAPKGRLACISFHSLEDRIVKNSFKELAGGRMEESLKYSIITKKPLVPSEEEQSANPRARSAKLRVIERL